jgi:hypothetical protein
VLTLFGKTADHIRQTICNNPNQLLHYAGMNPFGENRLNIIKEQDEKITKIFKDIIKCTS